MTTQNAQQQMAQPANPSTAPITTQAQASNGIVAQGGATDEQQAFWGAACGAGAGAAVIWRPISFEGRR